MRILLAGDTHGNLGHVRKLLDTAAARRVERIFQLGDFGYWEHEPAGVRFLDEVHRAARTAGVTVYFLDGNHDKSGLLTSRYGDRTDTEGFLSVRGRVRYAPRGHVWTWDGIRFLAFGGARSVDKDHRLAEEARRTEKARRREQYRRDAGRPAHDVRTAAGTLWFPEEEATDADAQAAIDTAGRVDVLLTHDKPRSSAPGVDRKDLPVCHPNQDRVQRLVDALRPRVAAHGHVHHRYTQTLSEPHPPTRVEGLGADPAASFGMADYRIDDSWLLLDTAAL